MLLNKVMAKLTGPLFSVAAHGTLGKAITYSKRNTHNHARFQKAQKDFVSIPRGAQRSKFFFANVLWRNLTQEQKDELESLM